MKTKDILLLASAALIPWFAHADALEAPLQARVDAQLKIIGTWAADPVIVQAVQAHNGAPSTDAAAMTQDKWKALTVLDPFVRSFSKNAVAQLIKSKKTQEVSEAFVSGAEGTKVAFLAKTSNWSHKGRPKHDVPMTGRTWQGPIEVDESTGLRQVQVAVPVLDGGKPVGSLVVGLSITRLAKE